MPRTSLARGAGARGFGSSRQWPDRGNLRRPRCQGGETASLSRPVSSPALITSCCHPFALRLDAVTGLLLLFEVGGEPPHDGMRKMGRSNLSSALAADRQQDRRSLRTHPTRRPREDIFLPEQNALSPWLQCF